MRIILSLIFVVAYCFAFAQTVDLDSEEWTSAEESRGMQVYYRSNPTAKMVECKIVAEINASQKELMAYLSDFQNLDDWATIFVEPQTLKESKKNEYLVYAKARSRMAAIDSDIILYFKFIEVNGGVVGYYNSCPDSLPVVSGFDRMQLFDGRWAVMAVDNHHCRFTYHLATDLGVKGLGDFLVRKLFLDVNMDSVERLRKHFAQPR